MKKILLLTAICAAVASCNAPSNEGFSDENKQNQSNATRPADWELTAKVKEHIMATSSLSNKARLVSVTTNDGVVTLVGTVASKEEALKVVEIAMAVPGVESVDNQLTIVKP